MVFQGLAQSDMAVYSEGLQNSWSDWSYNTTRTFNYSGTYVHSGTQAISVSITNGWGALSLHHGDIDTSAYTSLTFWINGGAVGGQQLRIYAELGTSGQPFVPLATLAPNTWQQVTLSLATLGVASQPNFARFSIQDRSGSAEPIFYLDDITLVAGPAAPPVTNIAVSIALDAQANRHPISPLIYGVAFASTSQLSDLNAPLNRSGGNAETRYNWQIDAQTAVPTGILKALAILRAHPGHRTTVSSLPPRPRAHSRC